MKKKIRQTVLIETERILIISGRTSRDFMICEKCGGQSPMISPEIIARVSDFRIREIYRLVEANELHFVEREKVYVCLKSLINHEAFPNDEFLRVEKDKTENKEEK